MIELVRGDILAADAEAIVNTVNCVGVMGKGLALQFKKTFLKSAGGAAAGLYLADPGSRAGAATETLALHGGAKAVTTPLEAFTRWPRFGDELA